MNKIKKVGDRLIYLLVLFSILILLLPSVLSFAGRVCGSTSPCTCGTNCSSGSGGNELFGNSQAYCDTNVIECFNTIDDCRDGTIVSLNYVKDITITSLNDSVFRVGDVIEIDATLYSLSANSEGVFFVYANATVNESVNWSVIYSTTFATADSNYHVKYNYTIPNKIGDHSIRVIDILAQVTNITCGRHAEADFPSYSDTDDMTFTVLGQLAPTINFTGPTPSNSTTQTTVTVIINVTHTETHPDTLILSWNGTNESQSYSGGSTSITKTNLKQGNYTYYVWVNDTFGNINQTETRTININTPIDIAIDSPSVNEIYSNLNINLNLTIEPTQIGKNITWVRYQLNNDNNVTISDKKLNISADISDPDGVINESLISYHNLSQSFVPDQLMEIKDISIRLKRIGNPNASLQIRTDNSNSPSNSILVNVSIDNSSVSNSVFSWINLSFNSTVILTNDTRYWLFLSYNGSDEDHYAWEASDENISRSGELLQNGTRDLLFRIFDYYRYRTIFNAVEGVNNLTIWANNSDNEVVSSSLITFTADTIPPTYTGIYESEDPIEIWNNLTISINVSDSSTSINTVIFEFNNTNYSMSQDSGNRYNLTLKVTSLGVNNYTFYINDTLNNLNISLRYNVYVNDTIGPSFLNISNTPNSTDDLDPNILINVTSVISDPGFVSSAILQIKNSTSNWTNITMLNSSSLYYGNFTPNNVDNWTYRIWTNDTSGNLEYSTNYTLDISYDYSWTRSPISYGALSGIKNTIVTIGNLTINNTGDYLVGFEISSNRGYVSFNKSSTFTLGPKNLTIIQVNATAPLEEAEYLITITVDALNDTASPSELVTNATLVSISSGPYLYMEIIQYNASVTRGDYVDLIAKITNIGNETATNVVSNWTVPSDWTTVPVDLNKTLGNISANKFEYHNISIYIDTDAATGSKTISIYAQSSQGANNSISKSVTVSSGTTTTTVTTTSSGGGGGSSSGGGGGGIIYKKPEYDIFIEAPKKIELIAEDKKTFEINITNSVEDTVLKNIRIDVSGFLLGKLILEPNEIEKLDYGEKKSLSLTLDIPKYMKFQNRSLILKFTADARDATDSEDNTRSEAVFEKTFEINLVILEITKEVAFKSLENAESDIDLIKTDGFNTILMEEMFVEAKNAFELKDYLKTKKISDAISLLKEKAIEVDALIKSTGEKIDESAERGFDMSEALEFLELAISSFNQGDFNNAEEMINKAILAERLSTKTQESNILLRLKNFIKDYWWAVILFLFISFVVSLILYKEYSIKSIKRKLISLDEDEKIVLKLIKKNQKYYYIDKAMSDRLYKKTISQYQKRIAEIERTKVNLKSKVISFLMKKNNKEALEKEYSSVKDLIKTIQDKYYLKKLITRESYVYSINEYRKRIAEIEKSLELINEKSINKKSIIDNTKENE